MVLEERIFVNITELISSSDKVSNSKCLRRMEIPKFILVEAWKLDSSWDKHAVSSLSNLLKRSLDTIENCFQDTWTELNGKWFTGSKNWVTVC